MTQRSRGRFVAIVGPDGAGKTTLAHSLLEAWEGDSWYVHWIPLVRQPLVELPGDTPPTPKNTSPSGSASSIIRLALNFVRFWAGYLIRVRPLVEGGALVVADRWGYGYVGQPLALRYSGPTRLADLATRAMPRPDLIVSLSGPPSLLHERKSELEVTEIEHELVRWNSLQLDPIVRLDASGPVPELTARVMDALASDR